MKKFIAIIFSVICIFGCSNNDNNKYIVGTNAQFAPFEYLEEDKIVGFDIDLLNLISKYSNLQFEIKDMSFDALIPSLQTKKIDLIIAGLTKTEDREKHILFSDPYFNSKQSVIIPKDKNVSFYDDLKGKNVGVILGFTGDTIMTEKNIANLKRFDSAFASISALNENKIDAVVLDDAVANNYIKNYENLKLANIESVEELCCIGARKNDTQLIEKINEALEKIRKSGEYDQLIEKYFK